MKERLIFVCVLFLLALPLISATAPFPLPNCLIEGIITNVTFESAHNNSCLENPPCPTDVALNYSDRYVLDINISDVSYGNGSVYAECENSYPVGQVGKFYINLDLISGNDSFEVNDSIEVGVYSSYPQTNYYILVNDSVEIDSCRHQGEMCGGIAGFACCSGLKCELDGGYPDAAGTCTVSTGDLICDDLCGDGICQEVVCEGEGCPCAETAETCAEDCVSSDGEEQISFNWIIFIVLAIIFIIIGLKILKWIFWTLAILAVALAVWIYVF